MKTFNRQGFHQTFPKLYHLAACLEKSKFPHMSQLIHVDETTSGKPCVVVTNGKYLVYYELYHELHIERGDYTCSKKTTSTITIDECTSIAFPNWHRVLPSNNHAEPRVALSTNFNLAAAQCIRIFPDTHYLDIKYLTKILNPDKESVIDDDLLAWKDGDKLCVESKDKTSLRLLMSIPK